MESMQTVLPEQPVETLIRQLTEPVWSESSVFTEKKFRQQYLIGPQLFQIQVFERRLESIDELTAVYKYFG